MPIEFSRTTSVKRITIPDVAPGDKPDKSDDGIHVDIPVIEKITFRDAKTQAQDYTFRFFNYSNYTDDTMDDTSDTTTRETHIHKVRNAVIDTSGSVTYDDGSALSVERIEKYRAADAKSNTQESVYRVYRNDQDPPPTNVSGLVATNPDTGLTQVRWVDGDGNIFTQKKSHVVRYYMNNDNTLDIWLDIELTDAFEFRDAKEGPGQGRIFTLNNDSTGDGSPGKPGKPVSDPSLPNPDTTDPFSPTEAVFGGEKPDNLGNSSTIVDPPWRLDPFQNIVNFNGDFFGTFIVIELTTSVFPIFPPGHVWIHSSLDGETWSTLLTPWNGAGPDGVGAIQGVFSAYGNGMWLVCGEINTDAGVQCTAIASTDFFNWTGVFATPVVPHGAPPPDDKITGLQYNSTPNTFSIFHGNPGDPPDIATVNNPIKRNARKYDPRPKFPVKKVPNFAGWGIHHSGEPGFSAEGFYLLLKDGSGGTFWSGPTLPSSTAGVPGYDEAGMSGFLQVAGGPSMIPPSTDPP